MAVTQLASGALKRQGLSSRFWVVGALTLGVAVVMNTLVALAAQALFTVAPVFSPLQIMSVVPTTVVAVVGALAVLAVVRQRSPRPVRLYRIIAVCALSLSLIPDALLLIMGWFPGATLPAVGTLMLMHVATALLCMSMAPRMIAARR